MKMNAQGFIALTVRSFGLIASCLASMDSLAAGVSLQLKPDPALVRKLAQVSFGKEGDSSAFYHCYSKIWGPDETTPPLFDGYIDPKKKESSVELPIAIETSKKAQSSTERCQREMPAPLNSPGLQTSKDVANVSRLYQVQTDEPSPATAGGTPLASIKFEDYCSRLDPTYSGHVPVNTTYFIKVVRHCTLESGSDTFNCKVISSENNRPGYSSSAIQKIFSEREVTLSPEASPDAK